MSADLLPRIADGVLIWCAVFALASVMHALLYPVLASCSTRATPEKIVDLGLLWALMPTVAAFLVTGLVLNPELSAALIPEHCHGLNCQPHLPTSGPDAALRVGLAGAASLLVLALAGATLYLVMGLQRRLRALFILSRPAPTPRYRIIEGARPEAWCIGWWRPQVYVSRALLACLNEAELQVVLEHEYAHQQRRDNLRLAVVALATYLWPRRYRQRLRHDVSAATEIACDNAAVRATGDTDLVASVITRLGGTSSLQPHMSNRRFASAYGGQRLDALNHVRPAPRQPTVAWIAVTASGLLHVFAATGLAHAGLELLH